MRTYKTLAAALFFTAIPVLGQPAAQNRPGNAAYFCCVQRYRNADLPKVSRNYLYCLRSDNTGIVESALAHVAYIRLALPAADLKDLKDAVRNLADKDCVPSVRYKAYLASMVFASPALFARIPDVPYADSREFFAAVDSQLRQDVPGHRGE